MIRSLSPLASTSAATAARQRGPRSQEFAEERGGTNVTFSACAALVTATGLAVAPQVHAGTVGEAPSRRDETLASLVKRSTTQVGDYTLYVRPADVDLKPSLKGGELGLRVKGEFLDSELAKATPLEGGWTQVQGLRGRLQGNFNTYGDNRANLNLEAFRRWEGKLDNGMQARFEVSGGTVYNILDSTTQVGFHLRQELKGGDFTWQNQPLSWHLEGRQGMWQRVQGSRPDEPALQWRYEFLVGVRRDFPMKIFGKPAVISTIVGPQFQGDHNHAFEVSPKLKLRVHY